MKTKFNLTVLILVLGINSFAQNPIWVCPPNYINSLNQFALPLPTGPATNDPNDPFDYYDGWSALQGSNGMQDVNGALRFFIIDGLIFDNQGAFADYAWSLNLPNVMYNSNSQPQPEGDGGGEILIIPHPTECNQYFIFGVATLWNDGVYIIEFIDLITNEKSISRIVKI